MSFGTPVLHGAGAELVSVTLSQLLWFLHQEHHVCHSSMWSLLCWQRIARFTELLEKGGCCFMHFSIPETFLLFVLLGEVVGFC